MLFQKKALYNLICLNLDRIQSGELKVEKLEPWQAENYRELTIEQLFQRLNKYGISFDSAAFRTYAKPFEMPEEMAESLTDEREPLEQDQIFLIIFELWRRLLPEKRSLSIFCDELDYQMSLYDLGKGTSISELQDALAYLQQILEEHVDQKIQPKQAFELKQSFCATDLESFLFDYILAELDAGNLSYATDLLEGFHRYFKEPVWFDYLNARADIERDPEEGYDRLEQVIRKGGKNISLDLVQEILFFLANTGNHSLFHLLATKFMPLLKREEDFKTFLEICYMHYEYLELQKPKEAITDLFYKRTNTPPEALLAESDPDALALRKILDQKLHFAIES